MKRIYFFVAISAAVIAGCSNNSSQQTTQEAVKPAKTDWEYNQLKGKVKEVRSYEFNVIVIQQYNNEGYAVREDRVFPDSTKQLCVLHRNADQTLQSRVFYNENNQCTDSVTFEYDAKGNAVKVSTYGTDGKIRAITQQHFNQNNDLILSCQFSDQGDTLREMRMKYDERKDLVDFFVVDKVGRFMEHQTRSYDSLHQLTARRVEHSLYGWDRKFEYNYELDALGNWLKRIEYEPETDVTTESVRQITYF